MSQGGLPISAGADPDRFLPSETRLTFAGRLIVPTTLEDQTSSTLSVTVTLSVQTDGICIQLIHLFWQVGIQNAIHK